MSRIILVPIEPLNERYSADWYDWFAEIGNFTVDAKPLTDKITQGSFLDICGTNYYKAQQLAYISKMIYDGRIKDGDVFLFLDLWFPGLEMLAYMRDALGINFKITGCLHAGTWDDYDFLSKQGMGSWAENIENGWFNFVDQIFVATNFHKKLICSCRNIESNKIKVTGFPIKTIFLKRQAKENIVVFPHRLDSEKNPNLFDKLADELKASFKDWQFVKSKEICSNKQEYYELLHRSKIAVSFADQETWGIAMQEAVICGCIPLVPDRLSYVEMYPKEFRFTSFDDAINAMKIYMKYLDNPWCPGSIDLKAKFLANGAAAIPNILREIENG
jgi:hypothetical protein